MMLMATVSSSLRAIVHVSRAPLAEGLEPFLVDGLQPEEQVVEAEALPAFEHLRVAHEDVAAGFEVVLLADPSSFDLVRDLHALVRLDERDVVHEEDPRLADALEVLRRRFR